MSSGRSARTGHLVRVSSRTSRRQSTSIETDHAPWRTPRRSRTWAGYVSAVATPHRPWGLSTRRLSVTTRDWGRVGLSPNPRPASPSRGASSLCGEHSAQDRMGGTHRTRDQRGDAWPPKARTNRQIASCTVRQSAYREYPPPTRLREARDQLEGAADPLRPRADVLIRSLLLT